MTGWRKLANLANLLRPTRGDRNKLGNFPNYRERLARAVESRNWTCLECECTSLRVTYDSAVGDWLPDTGHFDGCPVLDGGQAAFDSHGDLWEALEAVDPSLGVDYGPVAVWHPYPELAGA